MLNASKDHEADQGVHQGLPGSDKKGCSVDKVFGRTDWAMLGFAESAYTGLFDGLLCKGTISTIPLHDDLGRSLLHRIL